MNKQSLKAAVNTGQAGKDDKIGTIKLEVL